MSVSFFIGPFDPKLWMEGTPDPIPKSSLQIDPSKYQDALSERFPNAHGGDNAKWGHIWNLDEGHLHGVRVQLNRDRQHVSISSKGVNFLEFALWHREYVPDTYQLYFFNDSSWESLILAPATSIDEIKAFSGYEDKGIIKTSPLNGSWDGDVAYQSTDFRRVFSCTLHQFDYPDGPKAEFLLGSYKVDGGAIMSTLVGKFDVEEKYLILKRQSTRDIIGSGLPSYIAEYHQLELSLVRDSPDHLRGLVLDQNGGQLGSVKMKRRGLQ